MKKVRSPLFYVGDKYKLMPQLNELFPDNIRVFYDVFAGGGSASLNTFAESYVLNDIDIHITNLHRYLVDQLQHPGRFIDHEIKLMDYYGLSHSAQNIFPDNINELKTKFKKTYYAKANMEGYLCLRNDYNDDQKRIDLLYLLLVFGFNHMTRFNNSGKFNLPVGNVDWNNNVETALYMYSEFARKSQIKIKTLDFEKFVQDNNYQNGDFLYFDPPYSITLSEYNKLWNSDEDKRLFNLLDSLNNEGIIWGMSNVFAHKGNNNDPLRDWAAHYNVYEINANYISRFDNSIKKDTEEVYITNYSDPWRS